MFKVISTIFLGIIVTRAALASQLTFITSSKAVIYADRQLSTPIGYLPLGKKVRVGEGQQRGGKILPIIIDGKVAYIRVSDLALMEKYQGIRTGKHEVEHDTSSQFTAPEDKLSENIFLVASLSTISAAQQISGTGSSLRSSSNSEESEDQNNANTTLTEYTLYIEHRQPYGRYSWGIGLGFLQSTKTGETLESLILRGSFAGSLFQSHYFTLQGVFEPFYSGDVNLGTAPASDPDLPNEKLVGMLYGYRLAAQIRLFPLSKYGIVAGAGIEKTTVSQARTTDLIKDYKVNLSSKIIYGGISYKF